MKKFKVTFEKNVGYASITFQTTPHITQKDCVFVKATRFEPIGSTAKFFTNGLLTAYHTDVSSVELVK